MIKKIITVLQNTHYSNTVTVILFLCRFVPKMLDVSGELQVMPNRVMF